MSGARAATPALMLPSQNLSPVGTRSADTLPRIISATRAPLFWSVPGQMTRNSSPPRRHTMPSQADQSELVDWLGQADAEPDTVYVVHGEPKPSAALSENIQSSLGWCSVVPRYRERVLTGSTGRALRSAPLTRERASQNPPRSRSRPADPPRSRRGSRPCSPASAAQPRSPALPHAQSVRECSLPP